VARRLNLATSTTYRLLAEGAIPAVRIGNGPRPRLRVRETDLDAYLTAGTRRPTVTVDLEPEPVRDALAALREITPAWCDSRTEAESDREIAHRMRTLRLAVAAVTELAGQGNDAPTPAQVRGVMRDLALSFTFHPDALLELARAARDEGDSENADTLELAYRWHALLDFKGGAHMDDPHPDDEADAGNPAGEERSL